jgi:hypothetical protein
MDNRATARKPPLNKSEKGHEITAVLRPLDSTYEPKRRTVYPQLYAVCYIYTLWLVRGGVEIMNPRLDLHTLVPGGEDRVRAVEDIAKDLLVRLIIGTKNKSTLPT